MSPTHYASFYENKNHPQLLQQEFTSVLQVVSNNNRPVALKVIGKFSIVQNKRTKKVSRRCFYTKVQIISKFKCYMSDTLIKTRHTIASTCK